MNTNLVVLLTTNKHFDKIKKNKDELRMSSNRAFSMREDQGFQAVPAICRSGAILRETDPVLL